MGILMMVLVIIGFYFMLKPEDANFRFGISLRNQTKYLMCLFALYAFTDIVRIFIAVSVGTAFPFFSFIMLALNCYLVNLYWKKL